jgi:hypothetical protein
MQVIKLMKFEKEIQKESTKRLKMQDDTNKL